VISYRWIFGETNLTKYLFVNQRLTKFFQKFGECLICVGKNTFAPYQETYCCFSTPGVLILSAMPEFIHTFYHAEELAINFGETPTSDYTLPNGGG
jgi:hypothetical protein